MLIPTRTLLIAALSLAATGCWSAGVGAAPLESPELSADESGNPRIEEVLEGKVPGLSVQRRADGTYAVRLRGARAPGGGEPLVLLDGIPMGGPASLALADIDPRQVQRVEVIKDAASLSLYGTRGANGVIAITTHVR